MYCCEYVWQKLFILITTVLFRMQRHLNNLGKTLSSEEKREKIIQFEKECSGFSNVYCEICQSVGLNIRVGGNGKCKECNSQKDDDYLLKNNSLPIWYNEKGEVQYHVPIELAELSIAEKMLIQQASPFVPSAAACEAWSFWTGWTCLCF